ncbi:MAG: DNA/RNA non-specific endonuclease [Mangrovibacterium sp.]
MNTKVTHFLGTVLVFLLSYQFSFAQYCPQPTSGNLLIHHTYYSLSYSEKHEQAEWVYYELTQEEAKGGASRTNNFRPDNAVKTQSAQLADYNGSGYDRGHLAPAADMGFNDTAMTESFYFSNMSPQDPGFNRGIWKNLEALVRNWGLTYGAIHIATGAILNEDFPTIGSNEVSIPKYYYKVIFDANQQKAIGFILPNASSSANVQSFTVPIDEVERLTGIDFFYQLEDTIEETLESTFDVAQWTWSSTAKTAPKTTTKASESNTETSVNQCKATTQAGTRCKRKTSNANGYCTQHDKK